MGRKLQHGRYVAHHNQDTDRWEIRIVTAKGVFAHMARRMRDYAFYSDAIAAIEKLEEQLGPPCPRA